MHWLNVNSLNLNPQSPFIASLPYDWPHSYIHQQFSHKKTTLLVAKQCPTINSYNSIQYYNYVVTCTCNILGSPCLFSLSLDLVGLCKMTVSKDSSGHWVPPPASVMAAVSNQSLNRSLPSPTYGGSKSPNNA